jgi:hypothetical protein
MERTNKMTELIAKPIVKNQFWIVTDGEKKVGNIEANNAGYGVQINGHFLQFNNATELKKKTQIKFEPLKSNKTKAALPYPQYPTTARTYNSVFDIKRGLHLFTKTNKSKCQYAAGWFVMDQHGTQTISFCPKYIFIQRYNYKGPFKSEEDAKAALNT